MTASGLQKDQLKFNNYDKSFTGILLNDGRNLIWDIDVKADAGDMPNISGGGLGATGFILDQIKFHWGGEHPSKSCSGSEHLVEYQRAPMEIQFIHLNAKYSGQEAHNRSDGIAIVSFLIDIVKPGEDLLYDFSSIVNQLDKVMWPMNQTKMSLNLRHITPLVDGSSIYFRYDGSLTTPPCSENVKWTVFQERIAVPLLHLTAFRTKLWHQVGTNMDAKQIESNFRPIQRQRKREILTNGKGTWEAQQSPNKGSSLALPCCFTLVLYCLVQQSW